MPEGLIYVPENASRDYIIELMRLPAVGVHQDQVDLSNWAEAFEDPVATSEGLHTSLL